MGVIHLTAQIPPDMRQPRAALKAQMAQDLIRFDAVANESDAIRSLYGTGRYAMADIVMLIDDVRALAFQEIVAAEMSKP